MVRRSDSVSWRLIPDLALRDIAIGSSRNRQGAWNELIRRYGPSLRRAIIGVLMRHGPPFDDAQVDDLMQLTWVRMSRRDCNALRRWNPHRSPLGAFVAIVAMGETVKWYRRITKRREVLLDNLEMQRLTKDGGLTPEQTEWLKEAEHLLEIWKNELVPLDRTVFDLGMQGKDQLAIGRDIGRSQAFVSKITKRLKGAVEQLIDKVKL